jgi:general secretion pathway protein D
MKFARSNRSPHRIAWALACLLITQAAVPAGPEPKTMNSQAMITPNYKDADLTQIVEAVSQITGKNFILDPRVKAQVTMLSATPMNAAAFYEAFLAILQVHGFVAVPSGKLWKIIPDANARQVPANDLPDGASSSSDELVTQIVQLKSVNAAQLVPILRPLIPQQGHLAAYPASNVLIISDRASNVNRMLRIIDRIDHAGDDEIEVIRLEHASAAEIVRVVNQLNGAGGGAEGGATAKLLADERTNSVLISGERNQRLKLRTLVAHLDTPIESGGGTRVRYLKYADAEKLAAKLKEQVQNASAAPSTAAGAQTAQEKATTIWADVPTNALIITAPPKLMRGLMDIVDRLDIRRLEVQVEAIIVEITGDTNAQLGINWIMDASKENIGAGGFVSPFNSSGTSIATIAAGAATPSTLTSASIPNGLTFGVGRLGSKGNNFGVVLNALAGRANTNIISTPSVVTLDNEEAQIKVTTEVPFLTGQYASTGSQTGTGATGSTGVVNPFQTIQRQEVGTILKITPQITDDNTIMLKISQEVSALVKSAIATVDVQTSKRAVTTRVLANDGEIIVLGGLISDSVTGSEQKVPLFGDIPLIGNLFKTRSSSKQKTNLMIFIRPKILVNSEQMATETDAKYNYIRSLQLQYGASVPLQPREHQAVLPELQSLEPTTKTSATETPKARAMRGAAESANRGNAATPADTSAAPNSPSAPSGEDSTP